ncbi:MAG: RNA degradosome polyphosphate kinase [Maricaulaceae bacterium]
MADAPERAPEEVKPPQDWGPKRFINRELSWLAFNERVLEEAANTDHPLLERVRFLSISANNLDEFYMVRAAGLRAQVRAGIARPSQDGLSPAEALDRIDARATALMADQEAQWAALKTELAVEGLWVLSGEALDAEDRAWLLEDFLAHIQPVLTPLAVDPAHPFPFIPNLGSAVILRLRQGPDARPMVGLVQTPQGVPRFVVLPKRPDTERPRRFIAFEDALPLVCDALFPGFALEAHGAFRVIRDSDVEIEEEAEDLVREMEIGLKKRRRGEIVRLRFTPGTPQDLRDVVSEHVEAEPRDLVTGDGFLGLKDIDELIVKDRRELVFTPYEPRFPERIRDFGGDCFAAIRAKDILVHHPYESFDVVVQFLEQAACDPAVVAIKQTLYRTSKNSPIVKALLDAAEAGKNVTALIEIKARFDEDANLELARKLQRAGVQVVYGFVEYKTHGKLSLAVRREGEALRAYAHVGTGNYHPHTARIYTDLALFTADPAMTRDAGRIFNYITSYAAPQRLERMTIAPLSMKTELIDLIGAEAEHARAGRSGVVWAKMNSLVDAEIIDALYTASQAGARIELIIRGICCLRPGVPGLSETIRVKSIIGRFLEHSRIWCFGLGKPLPNPEAKVYLSSADWMPRNLDRRVEVMAPVETPTAHRQVLDQIMVANLLDQAQSWLMGPDGVYRRVQPPQDRTAFSAHAYFMTNPSLSGRGSALARDLPPELRMPGG